MSRKPKRAVVAGLDLSLTGTGIAVIDTEVYVKGGMDIASVRTRRVGVELTKATTRERVERLRWLADVITGELNQRRVTHVFVEDYSFGMTNRAHHLGELGGVVKLAVFVQLGLVAEPVSHSTARKMFIGRGSGKGIKDLVKAALVHVEAPFKDDEGDAFVIANYGIAQLGFPFLHVPIDTD